MAVSFDVLQVAVDLIVRAVLSSIPSIVIIIDGILASLKNAVFVNDGDTCLQLYLYGEKHLNRQINFA